MISPASSPAELYAADLVRAGVLSIVGAGEIWRHARRQNDEWRPITPRRIDAAEGRYYSVHISVDRRVRTIKVHRLVWVVTHGPIPQGVQVNHKDLNKANNHPTNLELTSAAGNIQHSYANGRTRPWAKVRDNQNAQWRGRSLVSQETKALIRKARKEGALLREIAEAHNLSVGYVGHLVERRTR